MRANLTQRLVDVINCFDDGLSYKSAAKRLGISPHTVQYYARRLYIMSNTRNKTQLCEWWRLKQAYSSRIFKSAYLVFPKIQNQI